MIYRYLTLFVLSLLFVCAACNISGSDDDDDDALSGTVTIPEASDIVNTEVQACFVDMTYDEELCNYASPNTKQIYIEETGTSASYRITELVEGKYELNAAKDFGGDGWWDFIAFNGNCGSDSCQYWQPPADDIDLAMYEVENDFRLRITGPDGVELTGTEVVFCVVDGEICDPEASSPRLRTTYSWEPGEDYKSQHFNIPPGEYVLIAGKDANGDGEWEVWNCYTIDGNVCEEVSPGTFQVFSIQMFETDLPPPAIRSQGKETALTPPNNLPLLSERNAGTWKWLSASRRGNGTIDEIQ